MNNLIMKLIVQDVIDRLLSNDPEYIKALKELNKKFAPIKGHRIEKPEQQEIYGTQSN